MIRIRLTEPQASIVEIHVLDSAHDDERQPWWPQLIGMFLVFEYEDAPAIAQLFVDAANSEENEVRWWAVATNIAQKVRLAARFTRD